MLADTVKNTARTFFSHTAVRWLMALAWTVWISIILIQPESQPVIDIGVRPAPPSLEREIVFTTLHIIAFSLMTGLWWWAFYERWPLKRALIAAVILAIIMGAFTESMQSFAPDRYPSWNDFIANFTGALLTAYSIYRRWSPRRVT
jgi:VanZ family protein